MLVGFSPRMTVYDIVTGERMNAYPINRRGSSLLMKCLCKVFFLPAVSIFLSTILLLIPTNHFSPAIFLYVLQVTGSTYGGNIRGGRVRTPSY